MKSLFKTSIMRKCLVFGVVLILTLTSFPMYAFADDDPGESSPGDRYATEEEIQELDNAISETSHNLALLMASGDTVKATDYEQATYNLLSSVFGSSTSSWASIVATRLGYLSTINSSANSLVVKLTGFYNSINPDYDTTGISMYDVVHGLLTSLTTIDPDDGDLTIIETLVYIHTKLEDLESSLTTILNSTYSIDAKIVNLHNFLINFRTDMNTGFNTVNTSINTGFTNVNANMATIISRLQSMQNDFNNISWTSYDSCLVTYSDGSSISSGASTSNSFKFSFNGVNISPSRSQYIYKFYFPWLVMDPSVRDSIKNVYLYNAGRLTKTPYYYEYDSISYGYFIYLFDAYIHTNSYIIVEFYDSLWIGNSNDQVDSFYINDSYLDYYSVYNWLINRHNQQIMDRINLLYASDDLIAAKEDQQGYEDQAIEDFTGSGSAAASGSDLTDMKSISSAIKSGLQSGGTVNNALAPFNTNSGFWAWFSQSNYDNINNIPTTRLRSGNNNEPEIIDFYSNNQYTLQGLLNGGGN